MTQNIHFEKLAPIAFPLANRFYKKAHEKGKTQRSDEVYISKIEQQTIAAVRLCPIVENTYVENTHVENMNMTNTTPKKLLLRSLAVLPEHRRTGIGSQFMKYVADMIGARECWCYPFSWLHAFYEESGFCVIVPEDAPDYIRLPFENYRRQGRDILIMVRTSDIADRG